MDSNSYVPPDVEDLCRRLAIPTFPDGRHRLGWTRITMEGSEIDPKYSDYHFQLDARLLSLPQSLIDFSKPYYQEIYNALPLGFHNQWKHYEGGFWLIPYPDDPSRIATIVRMIVKVRGIRPHLDALIKKGGFTDIQFSWSCRDMNETARLLNGLKIYHEAMISGDRDWKALDFLIKKAMEIYSSGGEFSKHRVAVACGANFGISAEGDTCPSKCHGCQAIDRLIKRCNPAWNWRKYILPRIK